MAIAISRGVRPAYPLIPMDELSFALSNALKAGHKTAEFSHNQQEAFVVPQGKPVDAQLGTPRSSEYENFDERSTCFGPTRPTPSKFSSVIFGLMTAESDAQIATQIIVSHPRSTRETIFQFKGTRAIAGPNRDAAC